MNGTLTSAGSTHPANSPDDVVISGFYPKLDGTTFDADYYANTHLPMVRKLWEPMGLKELQAVRGLPGPDGSEPPYHLIVMLRFGSTEDFGKALAAHSGEIFGDIPNFTNSELLVQLNAPLD